jgi:hypothetical protein
MPTRPATRAAVHVALGRAWLIAPDTAKALELARQAQAQDPASEAPCCWRWRCCPSTLAAESIVNDYLKTNPQNNSVRHDVRAGAGQSQRYGDACRSWRP